MTNEVHDAIQRLKSCCIYKYEILGCKKLHNSCNGCAYNDKVGEIFNICNEILLSQDLRTVIDAAAKGENDEKKHDD